MATFFKVINKLFPGFDLQYRAFTTSSANDHYLIYRQPGSNDLLVRHICHSLNSLRGRQDKAIGSEEIILRGLLRQLTLPVAMTPFCGKRIPKLLTSKRDVVVLMNSFCDSHDFGGAYSLLGLPHEIFSGTADLGAVESITPISRFSDYYYNTILHDIVGGFRNYCETIKLDGLHIQGISVEDWVWRKFRPVAEAAVDKLDGTNATDFVGRTPLHLATLQNYMPMTSWLLSSGADVNVKTRSGHTPLHYAVALGHSDACELLIKAGADVNAMDFHGKTPNFYAAHFCHQDMIGIGH